MVDTEKNGKQLWHNLADAARALLDRPAEMRGPFANDEDTLRRVAAMPPRVTASRSPEPSQAEAPAPDVKALEWRGTQGVWAKADALFGATYRITEYAGMEKPFKLEAAGFVGPSGHYEFMDEAKAAAQADYERRILSALSPAPSQKVGGWVMPTGPDWYERKAREEGDAEIGAGRRLTSTINLTPQEVTELERLSMAPVGWFNPCNDFHGYQQVAKEFEGTPGTIPLYTHPPASAPTKATHRHKKSGGEYVLIGIGKMQATDWYDCAGSQQEQSFEPVDIDMREVALYRSVKDGSLWARPREEFEDGRFEAIAALTAGRQA